MYDCTSSSFLGLPVTKVSVLLAPFEAIVCTRGGLLKASVRLFVCAKGMRELLGVLACFAASTVVLYVVAASLVREG